MSASVFDSPMYRDLFGAGDVAQLLTDAAQIRAMTLVLGALAKVQGEAGVIPEVSGAFLHKASMEVQIDAGALTGSVGSNGVTVPGLVAAFRKALDAPEHGQYLHWGATSQDIQDTAQSLRMRQVLLRIEEYLQKSLDGLAQLAFEHAETPQAARTYGQVAVPSSFGALVAAWGWPLVHLKDRLQTIRPHVLAVSLSGAAGTSSQLGASPLALRANFAAALGLSDPGASWHASRDRIWELADWLSAICSAGGKVGEDLTRLTRSDVGEVSLSGGGASSTMPQKENPVAAVVLLALARTAPAQAAALRTPHGEARDGAGWFAEWLTLPLVAASAARSAMVLAELPGKIAPNANAMAVNLSDPLGLIHAEALTFALTKTLPRPEAAAEVKRLATDARETGTALADLLKAAHPDVVLPALSGPASLGAAPDEARRFAQAARSGA